MKSKKPIGRPEDKRKSPRFDVHLTYSMPFSDDLSDAPLASITGHVCDISVGGMALVVPSVRFANRHLIGRDQTLGFVLELPTGPIDVEAVPVHLRPIGHGMSYVTSGTEDDPNPTEEQDEACLIGVRITEISERARALFDGYLRKLSKTTSARKTTTADADPDLQ